jgi:hypothetical protein
MLALTRLSARCRRLCLAWVLALAGLQLPTASVHAQFNDTLGRHPESEANLARDPRLDAPDPLASGPSHRSPEPTLETQRFDAYTDEHGITKGGAGNPGFEGYTNRFGFTSSPSSPDVNCVTGSYGLTSCR